jgi:hypothetical protein
VVGSVVFALNVALYDQSLRVGELDVNVLLGDARKLAVKVVGFLALTDVKARGERASRGLAASRAMGIVVVQETEKWGEVPRGWEAGTEERHVVWRNCLKRLYEKS